MNICKITPTKTQDVRWAPRHHSDITWYKPVQQKLCGCHCKSVHLLCAIKLLFLCEDLTAWKARCSLHESFRWKPEEEGERSMRHLMSTLIRIQFSPRYLDFEILESCRGNGDRSRLQDVIRLGNLAWYYTKTTAVSSYKLLPQCTLHAVYVPCKVFWRCSLCRSFAKILAVNFIYFW